MHNEEICTNILHLPIHDREYIPPSQQDVVKKNFSFLTFGACGSVFPAAASGTGSAARQEAQVDAPSIHDRAVVNSEWDRDCYHKTKAQKGAGHASRPGDQGPGCVSPGHDMRLRELAKQNSLGTRNMLR